MIKKTALWLALMTFLTFSSYAQQYTAMSDFQVWASGGEILILEYIGARKEIRIPSSILNLPVTTIGNRAFANAQITCVTIPNSITVIGQGAFENNQLANIVIPNSVNRIGEEAFAMNLLTNITIPDSVTMIGQRAFAGNLLTSVTIPDSVIMISAGAFEGNQINIIIIGKNVVLQDYIRNTGERIPVFENGFDDFYLKHGAKSGLYTFNNGHWSVLFK